MSKLFSTSANHLIPSFNELSSQLIKNNPKIFNKPHKQRKKIKLLTKKLASLLYWKLLDQMSESEFEQIMKLSNQSNKLLPWIKNNLERKIQFIWQEISKNDIILKILKNE